MYRYDVEWYQIPCTCTITKRPHQLEECLTYENSFLVLIISTWSSPPPRYSLIYMYSIRFLISIQGVCVFVCVMRYYDHLKILLLYLWPLNCFIIWFNSKHFQSHVYSFVICEASTSINSYEFEIFAVYGRLVVMVSLFGIL